MKKTLLTYRAKKSRTASLKRRKEKAVLKIHRLPKIVVGTHLEVPEGLPVAEYSYSMMRRFCTNPTMFRIIYKNGDRIDTTTGSTAVLGRIFHHAIATFLGGNDEYPVPNNDSEALLIALSAAQDSLQQYPDGFIEWRGNVPTREKLVQLVLASVPQYIKEWDRREFAEIEIVEEKLRQAVTVKSGKKTLELAIPLVGYPDLVYTDKEGRLKIIDHKTTFSYTPKDKVDGGKMLQAAMYYFLVYAKTGTKPYSMTFREHKISINRDGSKQTREYEIVFAEMPFVFELFFRLYNDMTRALLGEMVYVPNLDAFFDGDVALIAYINRLDEPDEVEKQMKRANVEDISQLLKKRLVNAQKMHKFMDTVESKFINEVKLDYKKMEIHDKIKFKLMEHGSSLIFSDKVEGLSVDMYRFEPTHGVSMKSIEGRQKDVEQAVATANVRILAPIPNTNLVGFEVPKKKRIFLHLSEAHKAPSLEVPFGVDVYGKRKDVDIRFMPHLLVAGTTGSGKSVFLNSMLHHLSRLPLHEISFVLLDPKMVELSDFENDPHTKVYAEDAMEIATVLILYVEEMNKRYTLFKEKKVKNLQQYREKYGNDIPYIVIVIDEFGDLIMQGGKVSKNIKMNMILLAQKARAAGIHLIITTQRPSSKIVDGLIKANFPTRVAFKTSSRIDSDIILDRGGAELLLGRGDMLLMMPDTTITRLQGYLT